LLSEKRELSVIISEKASENIKKAANELAEILNKISSKNTSVKTGDGSFGIVLGQSKNFSALPFTADFKNGPFERENYRIRTQKNGIWLIGASDLGASHAAWDLLYRLGYRQYFPGNTWQVIPPPSDLKISLNIFEKPDFNARRIWYNWGLWGYNNKPYEQWCIRNRMTKGFDLQSGHSYEAIIAANRAEFEANPAYIAQVNGKREITGDVKFCVSNPGLQNLVIKYALNYFKVNPNADSVSLDPSDGDRWCECSPCNTQFPTIADRAVTLGNVVGEALDKAGLDKRIGMYAYNKHTGPPTIKVHPRIIASATTAFIGGGLSHDQVLAGWQSKGATMGVYDYLSVIDWDWNLPGGGKGGRPEQIVNDIPRYHKLGARFYDAESGDCWGPCGLGYWISSRLLWNKENAAKSSELIEDFLNKAFPNCYEPMKDFYYLINIKHQRRSNSDLLGRMYRHLDKALKQEKISVEEKNRIKDLVLYTRHVELYTALADGRGQRDEVVRHAWRMRKTMMIHSYGIWCRLISHQAALDPKHPLKDKSPFSEAEISGFITNGIKNYQPVDPGFEPVTFSSKLEPAAKRLKLNTVPMGHYPGAPQDQQRWWLWLEKPGNLDIDVTIKKIWANRAPLLSLYASQSVYPDPVAVNDKIKADNKTHKVSLKSSHKGLHRLETRDGGDNTFINWPKIPVTIESGIDTPGVTSHMRGSWTLSFYVPKGTKNVGGWASRIANWAPPASGKLLDGDGKEIYDFTGKGDGWFNIPVPEGQDGKLWTFSKSIGQRLLMTVPPFLARTGSELLLPKEVIMKDSTTSK
ncbi:MAG: DUF4838 domain-containing protein, partial [Lentisphaeraceae bacterium]|nr:DUF4838 domain-containing protein [Lentisphaeraceae bacterium]